MVIKVLIFEDDEVLRQALHTLLDNSDKYHVAGAYGHADAAEVKTTELEPDVVLMDIDLPGTDGISAVGKIKEVDPQVSIIMYTQFEDEDRLFRSICAGADGYILKKTSPMHLFNSIEQAYLGGAPMSPSIAKKVLNTFRSQRIDCGKRYDLTPRESEILNLLVLGYSIKNIAAELFISYETVRSHLRNIYRKLHVNCGKEAIAKVLAERIVK